MLRTLIVVLGTVLVAALLFGLLLWWFMHRRRQGRTFGLPSFAALRQSPEFYAKHETETRKYLLAVYPTAQRSLERLSTLELACFYNSLWFYYNCSAKFGPQTIGSGDLRTRLCWKALPGCGSAEMPTLPYTPQGYIYSFQAWIDENWTPYIDSNSEIDPAEVTASVPGRTFWYFYNGPGLIWMYQRGIFRYVYAPQKTPLPRTPCANSDGMCVYPKVAPTLPHWKYPNEWWKGAPSGEYVEITAASEPGVPASPPMAWYDGWAGSGTFLAVGRTHVARNKVAAVFTLAQEMFRTTEGAARVKSWYGADDPYTLIRNVLTVSNLTTDCTSDGHCRCTAISPVLVRDEATGLAVPCHLCNANWAQNASLPTDDRGWFGAIDSFSTMNWAQYCSSLDEACIDSMMKGTDYRRERISDIGGWDEILFALGVYLGYDTIQMPYSANGSGFWQYEILELRDYPVEVKERDYTAFMTRKAGATCPPEINSLFYNPAFVKPYLQKVAQYITLRDPLDVHNENSVERCTIPTIDASPGSTINMTCAENLSNIFANRTIMRAACDPAGCDPDSRAPCK